MVFLRKVSSYKINQIPRNKCDNRDCRYAQTGTCNSDHNIETIFLFFLKKNELKI